MRKLSCCAFTLLAAACTEPLDGDELGVSTGAIISGNSLAAERAGFVELDLPAGRCSGTLISNEWILTARHCFDFPAPSGTIARMGTQSTPLAEIVRHPTLDAALVRTSSPLLMFTPATSIGFDRGLWRRPVTDLVGGLTQCVGYGLNDIDGPDVGGGVLRTAALPVNRVSGNHLVLLPSPSGQILAPGDSGGGCLNHDSSGEQVITGVANHVTVEVDLGPPEDLLEIADAYVLSTPQLRSWIAEVTMARELRFGSSCIDTTNGSRSSGTPLRTFPCNGTPSQRWRTIGTGAGSGQLQNVDSGRCMHVATSGVIGQIQQVDCDAVAPTLANQIFALQPHASGGTRIVASHSGSCIRVDAANQLVHAACGAAFDVGASAMIQTIPSAGHRTLHAASNGECIDVPWGQGTAGLAVNHFPCHDGTAQEWNLVPTSTLGAFQLRPRANAGLCLRDNITSVTQEPCGASTLQHWRLRPQIGGGYQLTTSIGACLTAPAASAALTTSSCTSGAADQRWHLRWY